MKCSKTLENNPCENFSNVVEFPVKQPTETLPPPVLDGFGRVRSFETEKTAEIKTDDISIEIKLKSKPEPPRAA